MRPEQSPDRAYLTAEGRHLLSERIRNLESTVAELHSSVEDSERTEDMVVDYQRTTQEIGRLRALLESAGAVDDVPDDPHIVDLGDTVVIQLDDGTEETYIVVHGAEAALEDQRISAESPLGQALLGRHIGERVEVKVPGGSYECLILRASRR
jgi:transcription elongation GreA/GreB family factor